MKILNALIQSENQPETLHEPAASHLEAESETRLALPELELHAIELFIRLARLFGLSKSIGEIYGFLFVCPTPVPLDVIREKLRMSNGSASQGLRLLRSVGAVKTAYIPGDRRDHYVVETGLATIASGFLREKIAPNISSQADRLARIFTLLAEMPAPHRTLVEARLQILEAWRRQAWAVLPKVMECLRAESTAFREGINTQCIEE